MIRDKQRFSLATSVGRRTFMKAAGAVSGAVASSAVFGVRSAWADSTINVMSWPGFFAEDTIGDWEKQSGVKVQVKGYTAGEEMVSLVRSSPPGTFDLILADNEYVSQLRLGDLIDELDPSTLPMANYVPEFNQFEGSWHDGKLYAPMVEFGYNGLVYNTEIFSDDEVQSYEVMWSDRVKGKLGSFDWYLNPMMILSAYLGNRPPHDITDAQFEEVKEGLFSLAPQMSGVGPWSSVFSQLANKESLMMVGIGDWAALLLQQSDVPVKAVVPQEGALQWTDCLAIPSASTRKETAMSLMQYLLSPEGQVKVATKSGYAASIPNLDGWALLARENPEWSERLRLRIDGPSVMDDFRAGRIHIRSTPKNQSIEDWTDAFTEFKGRI